MISELGHYVVCLALSISILQASLPLLGRAFGRPDWQLIARPAAYTQCLLVLLAFVALSYCFVVNDFSVAYVATNSNTDLPLAYRLAAVWGAHEGSLLLWVLMLSLWTVAVAIFSKQLPDDLVYLILALLAAVSVGFLLFMIGTSNPFDRQYPPAAEGRDLNPLLQDPGLIIHPPMLYMGYVGFSVAFAFALAALISGRMDTAWARWTRPWTTMAWAFLTLGIVLGSWWAYNELGWGGWWFWDPVENASFMPWLVGTALIHSLAVTEQRAAFKGWTLLLAITAFAMSLLGTFLVRSGVLVSVHAFATDPARGVYILSFFAIVVGGSLLLYAIRAPKFATGGVVQLLSREGFLLLNNIFLVVAAAAVLIGTLYPLFADAFNLGKLSVGPPYFNSVFVPLTLPLILLVGCAAALRWKGDSFSALWQRLKWPAITAIIIGAVLPWAFQGQGSIAVMAACILGAWAISTSLLELWRRKRTTGRIPMAIWGMSMAHLGLGVFVIGVTLVSQYSQESDVRLDPGQTAELAGFSFTLNGVQQAAGPNYDAQVGSVEVRKNDTQIALLKPEKRLYRAQGSSMTESGVHARLHRDLYVVLGEPLGGDSWSLRIYYRPFMRCVWLGGLLMMLGGILAVCDRRYRLKTQASGARS
ncbi:MAG: heme lyase CcmF/NrfE family subunit [Nevskiales bacterium]